MLRRERHTTYKASPSSSFSLLTKQRERRREGVFGRHIDAYRERKVYNSFVVAMVCGGGYQTEKHNRA